MKKIGSSIFTALLLCKTFTYAQTYTVPGAKV
jgi:hypothetical protein